jgi:hypothetical protein
LGIINRWDLWTVSSLQLFTSVSVNSANSARIFNTTL